MGHAWAMGGPQPKGQTCYDHRPHTVHGPNFELAETDGNFLTVAWATENPRKSLILVRGFGVQKN